MHCFHHVKPLSILLLSLVLVFAFSLHAFAAAPVSGDKSAAPSFKAGQKIVTTAITPLLKSRTVKSKQIMMLPKGTSLIFQCQFSSLSRVETLDKKSGYIRNQDFRLAVLPLQPSAAAKPVALTVSAASSLTDVMGEIQTLYKKERPNVNLTMNFGSSGSLQQQIEQGAPVDVFISAAEKQMDALEKGALLTTGSRRTLLKNKLVLIAPVGQSRITAFESLTSADVKLIANGDPDSVPSGKYAKETLQSLKLWDAVKDKQILCKDVRQVLTYIENGNADAGFVYVTDAKTTDKVKIVATADEKSHTPITYPAAVVKASKTQQAGADFLAFLSSKPVQAVFEKYGFDTNP